MIKMDTLLYTVTAFSVLTNDILPIVFIDDRAPEWYYRLQWYKVIALLVIGVVLTILKVPNITTLFMLSYITLTVITVATYYKYLDREAKIRSEKRMREYMEQPLENRLALEKGPETRSG